MALKKIYLPEQCYFITTNVSNKEWIFGKLENGIYVPNDELCQVIIDDLNFTRKSFNFLFHGYVIMPDHLHFILTTASMRVDEDLSSADCKISLNSTNLTAENKFSATRREDDGKYNNPSTRINEDSSSALENNISKIVKAIKGRSARKINNILGKSGQLWQHSFYEHCIRNDKDFEEKIEYIHDNPVRADLVKDPADFKYSSYKNYYYNDHSVIKIDLIE